MARGVFCYVCRKLLLGGTIGQRGEPEGARPASDAIMRVRLSLTSAHAPRRKARGVFRYVCRKLLLGGTIGQRGGEPEGARPASDQIMRARLALTSAHAPRRMARGVFC